MEYEIKDMKSNSSKMRRRRWRTAGKREVMATKQHLSKETSQDGLHILGNPCSFLSLCHNIMQSNDSQVFHDI